MFHEVESFCDVIMLKKQLEFAPVVSVTNAILKFLKFMKSRKESGYFLAVTSLKIVDKRKVPERNDHVSVRVALSCRAFLPEEGEILQGVVQRVHSFGVMLRCGPVKYALLSDRKMPNYHYVNGDDPAFVNDELSRIEKDVVVCFSVFGVRWNEESDVHDARREFHVLASIEGDSLGPVSLCGSDVSDELNL